MFGEHDIGREREREVMSMTNNIFLFVSCLPTMLHRMHLLSLADTATSAQFASSFRLGGCDRKMPWRQRWCERQGRKGAGRQQKGTVSAARTAESKKPVMLLLPSLRLQCQSALPPFKKNSIKPFVLPFFFLFLLHFFFFFSLACSKMLPCKPRDKNTNDVND